MVLSSHATSEIAGRYRIEGPLGRGGMAEVAAGTDLRLRRPVAVKFLLPEMAARDDIRRRFEAEARVAASLTHPHAVAVYDTGEHEGVPFIVMERLPGETLADRIAEGPQDPAWVRQVASEALGALGAAHAAGLVHRDVKPGNILVTADNHAKIADFGIAKSLEASEGRLDLTGTGQLLGTPAYLPPERLDGGPATPQSDLYSLGVVLYEALTGKCPFPGETPIATALAIVAGEHQPLDELRPGLDPGLVRAVERAMATDPARRFPSAAAMAAALAAPDPTVGVAGVAGAGAVGIAGVAGAGDPTLVHAAGPATAVLDPSALSGTAEVPLGAAPAGRRRSPVPLAVVLGLLFVALLVAGLNRGGGGAPNEPVSAETQTSAPAPTAPPESPATTVAGTQAPQTTVARPSVTGPAAGESKDDDRPGKDNGKGKGKDDDDD